MQWKALYVASRAEKKVQLRLTELGLNAYVPLKKERKQWSDRKKIVISPLINGYVFVQVNEKVRDEVFKASGVIQYVRWNGADAVVRDKEIEVLKDIEMKGYHTDAGPIDKFETGSRAVISHGQFKGLTGIIERTAGKEVYTINLESIGYSVRINLPAEVLKKTNS